MEEDNRQLALEVIVTLAETSPAALRKVGSKHVEHLIPVLLHMMSEVDDDADWAVQDDIQDVENDR